LGQILCDLSMIFSSGGHNCRHKKKTQDYVE